jgi:DNA-binding NtrC family response regulator
MQNTQKFNGEYSSKDLQYMPFNKDAHVAAAKNLRKVLVVDDEADVADMATMILDANGIVALTAYSAQEALEILGRETGIDAVVSDIRMPGMSGLKLADAIRKLYPKVKIVLVSGYALPSELVGRENQYLFATKPYNIETLLKLLNS